MRRREGRLVDKSQMTTRCNRKSDEVDAVCVDGEDEYAGVGEASVEDEVCAVVVAVRSLRVARLWSYLVSSSLWLAESRLAGWCG